MNVFAAQRQLSAKYLRISCISSHLRCKIPVGRAFCPAQTQNISQQWQQARLNHITAWGAHHYLSWQSCISKAQSVPNTGVIQASELVMHPKLLMLWPEASSLLRGTRHHMECACKIEMWVETLQLCFNHQGYCCCRARHTGLNFRSL